MGEVKSVNPQTKIDVVRDMLAQGQVLVPVVDEEHIPLGVMSLAVLSVGKTQRKKRFGWF